MIDKHCPGEDELAAFADADLSPEGLRRIEQHLEVCPGCAERVIALHALIADVAAKVPGPRLDVSEHVRGVMQRLDTPLARSPRRGWLLWTGAALAAAASVALAVGLRSSGSAGEPEPLTARGGPAAASLSRDVGLQLYAQEPSGLRALEAGDRVGASTPLTAGLRNLGNERAHLLLFAIDAQGVVHWIAPEFSAPGSDPEAAPVPPSTREQLLPSAAAFDDLAPGPLRVVAVIAKRATRVSEVESLAAGPLDADGLMRRFPRAEIRQYSLEVAAEGAP